VPLPAILTGNIRMGFLAGLMFIAPLELDKQFAAHPHFAGEYALRIEATDLFLIGLYACWLHELYWGKLREIGVSPLLVLWLLLTLWGLASVTVSVFPTVVVYEVIRMLKMAAIVFLLSNVLVRPKQFEVVALALLAGALAQALYGLGQYFFGLAIAQKFGELAVPVEERLGLGSASRVGAMLGHPNIFAAYLVQTCAIAFALVFAHTTPGKKTLYLATALLGTGALILTLARAGWLSLAVALGVLGAIVTVHPRLRTRGVYLRIGLVAALVFIGLIGSGHMLTKITKADPGGWPARMAFMGMAFEMIKAHPVTGIGLNTYMYVVEDYDFTGIDWGGALSAVRNRGNRI